MPQVTCPQCGAVNSTTTPDYPFCLGCQDNLKKCGYCRWFEIEPGVCTHREMAGVFDVAADATPPCDKHSPKDAILVPNRSLWAVIVVGLVAVLVLAYSIYQFSQPLAVAHQPRVASLEWNMSPHVPEAVVGRPIHIQVKITNAGEETVGGIRVQILNKSAPVFFKLLKMTPEAMEWTDAGEWTSYGYPPILPHEQLTIDLELVPREARPLSGGPAPVFPGWRQLPWNEATARPGCCRTEIPGDGRTCPMKPDDARLARKVRSEIIRRELNCQRLEVVVLHGVAYLSGELSGTKANRVPDGKKELEIVETVVRQVTGVRDVDMRIKWINL